MVQTSKRFYLSVETFSFGVFWIKGEPEVIRQREQAARDIFSQAVSKVRQPIESFFNWLNEKTEIQRASKVRATQGLLVHIFGKLAIALLSFVSV